MSRPLLPLLFSLLMLGGLMLRETRLPPLAGIEETFINWLAANSNGEHVRAPLTLVEINDNCLLEFPWPWSPLNYAAFLDGALQFKARVAAIEPVLAWDPRKLSPEAAIQQPQYEKLLHYRILQTPKLELGAQLGFPEDPDVLPPVQPVRVIRNVRGALDAVPEYTAIEAEPPEELRLAAALGFANVPAVEATAAHCPLVFRYRGEVVPGFALQAMMLWYGVVPDEVEVFLGRSIRLGNKLAIPVNSSGAMLVDWKQPYERAGFDDFELSVDQVEHQHAPVIEPAKLKDRLILLARTDAKAQSMQLPDGRIGSAGELLAAAIATAETNAFAMPAGHAGQACVLVLCMGLSWGISRRGRLWTIPMVVGFCAAYVLLCVAIFEGTRIALPLTPTLVLAAFAGVYRLLME